MPATAQTARDLVERYRSGANDEISGGYARELAGTIIGYAIPGSRRALTENLDYEAQEAYKTGNYEIAIDRFAHHLGIHEADPHTTQVSELRAILTSNIGACLHHLGDADGAVEYYERALQEFKAVPFTLYSRLSVIWVLYGNVTDKRVEYVEKKLASIRAGEAPDGSTYQDGYGKARQWTKTEMEGKRSWSIFSPSSWFGYGKLQEVGVASQAQDDRVNSGAGGV